MSTLKGSPDLLIFLLASISSWPQPPGVIVDHISKDHLLSLHINAELNLQRDKRAAVKWLQEYMLRKPV